LELLVFELSPVPALKCLIAPLESDEKIGGGWHSKEFKEVMTSGMLRMSHCMLKVLSENFREEQEEMKREMES
jgi:hypothetical protein